METYRINEQSELHDRYMQFSITEIKFLPNVFNKCKDELYQEIMSFKKQMTKVRLDIDKLKQYKMSLCYEYQITYSQNKKPIELNKIGKYSTIKDTFPSMRKIFPPNYFRTTSQILLQCDIIILQMILYFDINFSVEYTQNFLCLYNDYLANYNSRIMYMIIVEYLLEFFRLRPVDPDMYNPSGTYIEILKSWIEKYKNPEWKTLASISSKLIDIFQWNDIVRPLWKYVMHLNSQLDIPYYRIVTILSSMADICFLSFDSVSYVQRDIYRKNTFWTLILEGLASSMPQCRKQALYIMKTAVNSLNKNIRSNLITSEYTKAEITPFICNQIIISPSADCVKEKFFLVYEALEQEQDDLVMPALTHVTDLIEANKKHNICKCFDITWLRCIFEKALKHKNTQVTKWGVSHVLKLDEAIFDVHFFEIFTNTLNNTFLYECQSVEDCPGIVGELAEFFKRGQKSNLFQEFIMNVNDYVSEPIAIFYIMHALQILSPEEIQYCAWQTDELESIKLLVEENLSESSSISHIAAQHELLQAIPNYIHQIDDLSLLADILGTFSCLARETDSWNVITTWLSCILSDETAVEFINDTCTEYLTPQTPQLNLKTFAMMICLLHDANLIFQQQNSECPAIMSLNHLLNIWNTSDDILERINATKFISYLIDISMRGFQNEDMLKFISLHVKTTFNFLIENMRVMSMKLSCKQYRKYTNIVASHLNSLSFISVEVTRNTQSYAERLQRESRNLINDLQSNLNLVEFMQYLYGLHILYLSQEVNANCLNNCRNYILYILTMSMNICQSRHVTNLRREIVAEYLLLLSKLIYQYLVNNSLRTLTIPIHRLLFYLLQFSKFIQLKNIPDIANILRRIIDNFLCEKNDEYMDNVRIVMCIFDVSLSRIVENREDNILWAAIQSLMQVIINNNFLRLPDATNFIKNHIHCLLTRKIPKLNMIILSTLAHLEVGNILQLEELLATCLFYGIMYHSDDSVEYHHSLFIAKHSKLDYSEYIFKLDYNNCVAIRAETILLLHKVLSHSIGYAETFARFVIKAMVREINWQLYKHLPLYKMQYRQMQILLILEPVLNKELILLIYKNLCNFIYAESNHSSVRLMQEWLMIRILIKNSDLHEELWSLFEKSIKNQPSCTISLASIVYHVTKLLSDDNQKIFIETALPYIERCCFVQQCNARIHNQFILKHLYELMKSIYGDKSVSKYKYIYQIAVTSLHRNSIESSIRIQDDFYLSHFHPINHYSLQTIFYEFPRLTNMNFDEWISPDVFKMLTFNRSDKHPLRLYNKNSLLSDTKSSIYLTKLFADLDDVSGMIKELIYTLDIELQKGLIIIASFADQPSNLDDIAKMCRTYKIKTLIVMNTDCVKNEELEYLSVSADKWLNIIQVEPRELQKFLLDRKNAGWSLIGIERTIHSVDIKTTPLEKKTIFILGNEKNGIPVNFIPLFDKCVEILQVNTKCPLSVHFTTAICIYQYIKQTS